MKVVSGYEMRCIDRTVRCLNSMHNTNDYHDFQQMLLIIHWNNMMNLYHMMFTWPTRNYYSIWYECL